MIIDYSFHCFDEMETFFFVHNSASQGDEGCHICSLINLHGYFYSLHGEVEIYLRFTCVYDVSLMIMLVDFIVEQMQSPLYLPNERAIFLLPLLYTFLPAKGGGYLIGRRRETVELDFYSEKKK